MRVITWNCLGVWSNDRKGFQNKKEAVLKQRPDILVVPECESLEKLSFPEDCRPTGQDRIFDEEQERGLAVFCFNGFQLERLDRFDPEIKYFLPLRIFKGDLSLTVLATWIWKNPKDTNPMKYLEIFSAAVDFYAPILNREKVLFLGDFNTPGAENNLDRPKLGNRFLKKHLAIVEKLGFKSLFHEMKGVAHGKENSEDATLYFNNDPRQPFHCDYCFASSDILDRKQSVEIGKPALWLQLSDHMPLIVKLDLESSIE